MKKSPSLVFFGNERLSSGFSPQGAPTLEALIAHGYDVKAIVAHNETARSRKARPLEIEEVAQRHSIPVLLPKKLADIREQLEAYQADIGVLVAFGKIIPQNIIDIFPHGILNIHPSLLPRYRGSIPIEQAILDGASETGVSVMGLVKEMDAGPLFAQTTVPLTGAETKQELTQKLLTIGGSMIIAVLPGVVQGSLRPQPQDESQATYTQLIQKNDGVIDTSKSALQLEREIRAYAFWPKSKFTLFGHPVTITKAHVVQAEKDADLAIACNPGWLAIDELIAPSGKTMRGADFIRGYKKD